MEIIVKASDHFDERKNGIKPSFIIIHYTESKTAEDPDGYFMNTKPHPEGKRVSAHYMIDRDGTVYQYVDESKRAWHAGVSYWDGMTDINTHSIGIELINPGRKYGYIPFTVQQMDALVQLCKEIMARHHISPWRVLAHSDIAPSRKADPGELFDWKTMALAHLSVWPEPNDEDRRIAYDYLRDEQSLREAFTRAGYNPADDLKDIIIAFQRHFCPEAFKSQEEAGKMTAAQAARLHWLVRNKPTL